MMDHFKGFIQSHIFILVDCPHTVGAGGDDFAGFGGVQVFDVPFRQHLEEEFIARSAGGVTGAHFFFQYAEIDSGFFQQVGEGLGDFTVVGVVFSHAAQPVDVFVTVVDGDLRFFDEFESFRGLVFPGIPCPFEVVEQRAHG